MINYLLLSILIFYGSVGRSQSDEKTNFAADSLMKNEIIPLKKNLDSIKEYQPNNERLKYKGSFGIDLYVLNTNFPQSGVWGTGTDIMLFISNRWSSGLSLGVTPQQQAQQFSQIVTEPILEYAEVGWMNRFAFVSRNRIRFNVELLNGIASTTLRDKSVLVTRHTRYGDRLIPQKITSNTLYLIQPGVALSIRGTNPRRYPQLYFTAAMKYQYLIGNTGFLMKKGWNNYSLRLGISLIGIQRKTSTRYNQRIKSREK